MNKVLSIYNAAAYKEEFLPDINNADYSIVLSQSLFGTDEDIVLKFDVINGQWTVYPTNQYRLYVEKDQKHKITLSQGIRFFVYLKNGTTISILVDETSSSFVKFKKYKLKKDLVTIGTVQENDIVNISSSLMSKKHMRFEKNSVGWVIKDLSKNGVYVNSKKVDYTQKLMFGDYICAFGLKMLFLGDVIAVNEDEKNIFVNPNSKSLSLIESDISSPPVSSASVISKRGGHYNRAPRVFEKIFSDKVSIEAPPAPRQASKKSFFSTIGPSFTMVIPMIMGCLLMMISNRGSGTGAFMYTGLVTAGSSALLGIFWGTMNFRNSRKQEKEEESARYEKYRDYLMEISENLKEQYKNNVNVLLDKYPSAEICAKYTDKTSSLWSRNFNHDDCLFCRLGIGNMPFQVEIDVPKKQFFMEEDMLADTGKKIYEKYSILKGVPIGIDFGRDRLVGIVGGKNRIGAAEIMKIMAVQIAANNCYTDVKTAYIFSDKSETSGRLSFLKWLPHTWSVDSKTRFFASNKAEASDVCYELTKIFRMRDEARSTFGDSKKNYVKPHYIIFVEDISMLEGEPILKYIFNSEKAFGVTAVLLSERYEELPNNCEKIIFNNGEYSGIYTPQTMSNLNNNIKFDNLLDSKAEIFARSIAGVEVSEITTEGEIPASLTFLDMYNAESINDLGVIDRWRKNRTYETMKALVGKKSGGLDCYLDLHEKYHGPHGLVAGTTGSGKSEILQTYILSMAINFSPDDVAFLIIDFKGGGMANLFSRLPHLAGRVSNLSGNQVRRAMISIKSENIRRQKIFGEYGVNNINQYTRLLKNNDASILIPHLFIVIDEFAELKREQPEFLNELISIAQVGRSLGIHLILATQKPAGTVDDNIRSNSKFKLCLRVQDKQDSIDMINKPDAAYIYNAGRCYLQVGNDEIFELFQSGWSGAVYDADASHSHNAVSLLTPTGHVALVGKKSALKRREIQKKEWLSAIIECVNAAAENLQISLSHAFLTADEITAITLKAFEIMEQVDFEYESSSKNISRVKQLIALMAELDSSDAATIISHAERNGLVLPEPKDIVQLDAVVRYLENEAKKYGYNRPAAIWLPMLPERLLYEEIAKRNKNAEEICNWQDADSSAWTLSVPIGKYDDPMNQSQEPVLIDLASDGHFVICGGINSGKSTCLQTYIWGLINTYSPQMVNLYILDFSSNILQAFQNAPHVGGVMCENDEDVISKFFCMIMQILKQRKRAFRGGNYAQFVKSNGYEYPSIIIVIDNYANFCEKTDNKYTDLILELSREGISCGIFLVISCGGFGMSELQNKIADNMGKVVALNMGERQKYLDVFRINRIEVIPEEVQGRGLVEVDGNILEFQTAICLSSEDAYTLGEKISGHIEKICSSYNGKSAKKVPCIPDKPIWKDLKSHEDFKEIIAGPYLVPFAYNKDDASLSSIDLRETYCYLIAGRARTGRTNTLKVLALSAKEKNAQICIVDSSLQPLKKFSEKIGSAYVSEKKEFYDYLMEFKDIVKERSVIKKAMEEEGAEDEEIFEAMSHKQMIAFFISDFSEFVKMVYSTSADVGNISAFLENILEKGRLLNIYFFFDLNSEDIPLVSNRRIYSIAASYRQGIHLGGNIASQRLFDFSSLTLGYSEQNKTYKAGIGFMTGTEESPSKQVIIPFVKGEK